MMRLGRLQFALVLTLGVALVASVGMILRQSWRLAALQRQRAADLQSLRELQEALRQRELQKAPAEAESPTPPGDYQAALAQRNATIEQLNRELSEAQANIMGLQAQLSNSSEEHEKALASANERHQKEQAGLAEPARRLETGTRIRPGRVTSFPPTPRQLWKRTTPS